MGRTAWLLGAALVAAGLFLLACLAGYAIRPQILDPLLNLVMAFTALPAAWASRLNVAIALAAAGALIGSLGVLIVQRQTERLRREAMKRDDRLRRVHLYRADARREPFIGRAPQPEKNALVGRRAAR